MELTDHELARLYDRYGHVLFHRCRSILRNDEDARDAVQDTFARVLRHAEAFRAEASPLTWMYRISTNLCLNRLRDRRGRERKHDDHREELGGPGVTEPTDDDAADRLRVLALLDDADDETRACVVHTFFDDCTREEVAALVGLSVPTVRKRVNTFVDGARRTLGLTFATAVTALVLSLPWSFR
jgi:RNA polymerase sigma-70 factor, ECF subfamily